MTYVVLFGGDRWRPVEWCVVAARDGVPVGLASLARTDEMGAGGPHIIGCWVDPDARRQGIGIRLITAAATVCQSVYGPAPIAEAVTREGWALLQAAVRDGVRVQPRDLSAGDSGLLPW